MKLLPFERFKIKTRLNKQNVIKKLDNVVEPKRYWRFWGTNEKPYQGKIEDSHFEISRIIGYRNSFLPIIKGNVESEISGCSIYISMQPHILVTAFMVFWLGNVGFAFLALLSALLLSVGQTYGAGPSSLLLPVGMFILGYTLFWGGFQFEAVKSKKFFIELLEAAEIEEMGFSREN